MKQSLTQTAHVATVTSPGEAGPSSEKQTASFARQPFRPDIQGLRGLAVALVVLYHGGLPFLPGGYIGVDVFFVISGFLITNHLLASLDRDGRISFAQFYAKRARRILPASFAVLIASMVAGFMFLPPLARERIFEGAIATALYVPNLFFARTGTDYLAETTPSLFQHYWSLGVEEQFYLIWPAMLALGFLIARRSKRGLFAMVVAFAAVSFAACLVLTTISQPWAFFSLPTRAWELAAGGILAFLINRAASLNPSVSAIMGWVGLGGLIVVGSTFSSATPYPSVMTAIPVALTMLVLIAGAAPARFGPGVVLRTRGIVFVGTISYSLYLVHWPLLVIFEQHDGLGRELPLVMSLGLSLLAVPLAYCCYRWIELPGIRGWRLAGARPRFTAFAAGALTTAVVASSLFALRATESIDIESDRAATTLTTTETPVFTDFVPTNLSPTLRAASGDNPIIYADGCHADDAQTEPLGCRYGTGTAPVKVALFGDSHSAQWFPALERLAAEGLIDLRVDTKSSCPSVDVEKLYLGNPYVECDKWRWAVIEELNEEAPDVVILSSYSRSDGFENLTASRWANGLDLTLGALTNVGEVAVIRDTPLLGVQPATCLSAQINDAFACGTTREEGLSGQYSDEEAAIVRQRGGKYIDLTDQICGDRCELITGSTLIYRDSNHLTATFVAGLSDELGSQILN
ncbi:acyltransferase family protein [Marisediminicola sp. LYQ134]|uniref:acyltransferase family protein n=1 Tax=Marisediminicola sp. LYQ134 TaxID=3391061 RepID=UPI003982D995